MIFLIGAVFVLALLYGPQLWAHWVIRRYSRPRDDLPGSGGQLARHLLDRFDLHDVPVEETEHGDGDHYDPTARAVRLSPDNLNGRSLTAVAVAAHEVGHAIQHKVGYGPLIWRGRLVVLAQRAEKLGVGVMMVMPILAALTRSPTLSAAMLVIGLLSMAVMAVVHLVTLPVEMDASFNRALPLLQEGSYLKERDMRAARRVLRACAMTYLAASLAGLLNVWRWWQLLRR